MSKLAAEATGRPSSSPRRNSLGTPRIRVVTGATKTRARIGRVAAHDEKRPSLLVGRLAPPQLTATMLEMRNAFSLPTSRADDSPDHWKGVPGDGSFYYGLGVMGFCFDQTGCSADEIEVVGHRGQWVGSNVLLAHHRDSATTMVVHLNSDNAEPPQTFALVADALEQLGLT